MGISEFFLAASSFANILQFLRIFSLCFFNYLSIYCQLKSTFEFFFITIFLTEING